MLVLGHFGGRDQRAINIGAGGRRLAIADDPGADLRADTVGADQRRRLDGFAGREFHRDAAVMDVEIHNPGVGAQLYRGETLAAAQERAVDIGTMRNRVRVAEALAERGAGRDVDESLARDAVLDDQALDQQSILLRVLPDAERVEHGQGVGCDL